MRTREVFAQQQLVLAQLDAELREAPPFIPKGGRLEQRPG